MGTIPREKSILQHFGIKDMNISGSVADWAHPKLRKLLHLLRELIHVPRSTVLTDYVWFHGLVQPAVVFQSQQLNQLARSLPQLSFPLVSRPLVSVPRGRRGQHQCILRPLSTGGATKSLTVFIGSSFSTRSWGKGVPIALLCQMTGTGSLLHPRENHTLKQRKVLYGKSWMPCPQWLCLQLGPADHRERVGLVTEGSRLLGLQSAPGHCWLLVTIIYFKKKFRKISAETPKFAACCCFYTQPELRDMSHLVQKG